MSHIVGIGEAGRGPLAGPVAVGAVSIAYPERSRGMWKRFFKGIKDSKQLSPEEREFWFALAQEGRRRSELDFRVSLVSERVIDRHGIAYAIRLGVKRVLRRLEIDGGDSQIFLDGALRAPIEFKHQLTVIRGDEKIPIISLASICAKVVRDRKMVRMAKKYPEYDFDQHKGYSTRMHREAIRKYGSTELHRKSFLKKIAKR